MKEMALQGLVVDYCGLAEETGGERRRVGECALCTCVASRSITQNKNTAEGPRTLEMQCNLKTKTSKTRENSACFSGFYSSTAY